MPRSEVSKLQPQPVTLERIAVEASVSKATVSKVLNGRDGVADSTRRRVEALLKRHGYRRRVAERAHPNHIELVFEFIEGPWVLALIRAVETAARAQGLAVTCTERGSRHAPHRDWLEGVLQRRPVGLVLVISALDAAESTALDARGIPIVVVDPAGDPSPGVSSVGASNWTGGFQATEHLVQNGHRRIGVISGPSDMMCARARVAGYRSALAAAGIEPSPQLIAEGDFGRDSGIEAGLALLSLDDPPSAIFASSDLLAVGAYEAVRRLGRSVPADVSIVGFDDVDIAAWISPSLTTVHQPVNDMAAEALRILGSLRAHGQSAAVQSELATHLVVRESVRRLSIETS